MFEGGSPWSILALAFMPAPVTVLAGASNNSLFGANALNLFALPPNSKVLLLYVGTRVNAAAGGSGLYQFRIDGVDNAVSQTVIGNLRSMIVVATRIATGPGNHLIDVKMTAAVGDETANDTGVMFALGSVGT